MSLTYYDSPLGRIVLTADDIGLTGLWFLDQGYPLQDVGSSCDDVIDDAIGWLDAYFQGDVPDIPVRLHPIGTEFQMSVWDEIRRIPYGGTTTYGAIARTMAEKRGISRMSAQAVGNAVGRNPIAIIIPCHRVIGSDGSMTGYAGGIDRKIGLLSIEGNIG